MRIVFLIQDCTTMGGTERITCCLASEMARQGHEVAIVSVFGTGRECKFELDSRVRFVIASSENYGLQMNEIHRFSMIGKMTDMIENNELMREADVVIAQKFFAAALAVNAGFGRKTLVGDHYTYYLYGFFLRCFRNHIYRKAAAVVVLTEGNAKLYKRHGVRRVEVIPNMLPIKPAQHKGEGKKEMIAVGRLTPQKGFDILVQVMYMIRWQIEDWHLTIYGEGEDRPMLEQMIEARGLEDMITLHGATDNVSKAYQNASFGIMSSRFEGFPMVLLEAAATGLPMVAFDCPTGPSEIYKDGGGIVVPHMDMQALGEAIVRLTRNERLRLRLSMETADIREKYSEENIYRRWIEVIGKHIKK